MNRQQRIALIVCGVLVGSTLVYAPFQVLGRSLGYGWLFAPPHPYAIIDTGQLSVEWAAILLLSGLAIFLLRGDGAVFNLPNAVVPLLIIVLRIVRGIFGLIALLQVFGLLPILTWFANPAGINGEMLAQVVIKTITLLIFLGLFLSMRRLINWVHEKKHGSLHPSLLHRWSL